MAEFLSAEWLEELNRAAAGAQPAEGDGSLTLQQVVTRPDGTATTYLVSVDCGRVRLRPCGVEDPDVTLTTDYDTAVGVSRGEVSAHAALLAGRVRVRGDSGGLVRMSEVLARAQACWDTVRARTEY